MIPILAMSDVPFALLMAGCPLPPRTATAPAASCIRRAPDSGQRRVALSGRGLRREGCTIADVRKALFLDRLYRPAEALALFDAGSCGGGAVCAQGHGIFRPMKAPAQAILQADSKFTGCSKRVVGTK
jgi:hypothetical protein